MSTTSITTPDIQDPVANVQAVVTFFADQDFTSRVGIAVLVILFLFFILQLIIISGLYFPIDSLD